MTSVGELAEKRVIVTGGSGFLGRHLARALLGTGALVRSFHAGSRGPFAGLEDVADRVEVAVGDVRDPDAVRRAVRGGDIVCHLAAINGTSHFYDRPHEVLDVAVRGMLNVVDACRAEGVGDLVVASSPEVYQTPPAVPTDESAPLVIPDPRNPRYSYGGGKILAELMAIHFGRAHLRRAVIARPHNIYGPGMGQGHVVSQLIARVDALDRQCPGPGPLRLLIQGTGLETRSFCYIDDLAGGLLRIVERGEHLGIYHVGNDEETTIAELAVQIGRCFGREVEVVPGPALEGGTSRRCPDIGRLLGLGFAPKVPLRDGLERTVRRDCGAVGGDARTPAGHGPM
jgi:dTDP-glucose 4,6-dehydratase/UDP-glucose 4-epimerase